jgi:hypothetical protein
LSPLSVYRRAIKKQRHYNVHQVWCTLYRCSPRAESEKKVWWWHGLPVHIGLHIILLACNRSGTEERRTIFQ